MENIICKKDWVSIRGDKFIKGNIYKIETHNIDIFKLSCCENRFHTFIGDWLLNNFFYSKYEERKLKLKKLNEI